MLDYWCLPLVDYINLTTFLQIIIIISLISYHKKSCMKLTLVALLDISSGLDISGRSYFSYIFYQIGCHSYFFVYQKGWLSNGIWDSIKCEKYLFQSSKLFFETFPTSALLNSNFEVNFLFFIHHQNHGSFQLLSKMLKVAPSRMVRRFPWNVIW